jgi:hypothetical protein
MSEADNRYQPRSHHLDKRANALISGLDEGDADQAFDTNEAGAQINMSPAWLQMARYGGYGPPYYRIGRSIRYSRRQLRQWLAEREYKHTKEYTQKITRFGPGAAATESKEDAA